MASTTYRDFLRRIEGNASQEPGRAARAVVRRATHCVTGRTPAEANPGVSLTPCACDMDSTPLLALPKADSPSAPRDTQALLSYSDDRDLDMGSKLLSVTIAGELLPAKERRRRFRFESRHPEARAKLRSGELELWIVQPVRVDLSVDAEDPIALTAAAFLLDVDDLNTTAEGKPPKLLAEHEKEALDHLNDDHPEMAVVLAQQLLGLPQAAWHLVGIDPEGLDLRGGMHLARLPFEHSVADLQTLRETLQGLLELAGHAWNASNRG